MNWETISGICAIIGVFYYYYQFHYLPKKELEEEKINLLAQYNTSQKLIDNLINDIKTYSKKHNCYNSFFSQGVTFSSYIAYLENMRATELSSEIYEKLYSSDFSKENIALMISNLKNQIQSFNISQAHFDTIFKYS